MKIQLTALALMFCMTQSVVWGQEATTPVAPASAPYIVSGQGGPATVWRSGQTNELSKAMKSLKAAESDDDREKAIEQLRAALDDQYDKSLENYVEYLNQLEEKIETLRKQVTKRRSAKDELVELKLKMMINEADGLGWPDSRPSGFFNSYGRFPNSQFGNLYLPGEARAESGLSTRPARTMTVPRASSQSDR